MGNRIENAIIAACAALIAVIVTIVIVQVTAIKPLERQVQAQNSVIIELAKIEKYKYEIRNDFDKLKPKDSQIIIDLDNKLQGLQVTYPDTTLLDTVMSKRTFWRKIAFWK